jgi:hypothetical protein
VRFRASERPPVFLIEFPIDPSDESSDEFKLDRRSLSSQTLGFGFRRNDFLDLGS